MNIRNRKNDPKSAIIALGIVILISVISTAIENGSEGLGILIAIIIGAVAVFAAVRKAAKTKKEEQRLADKVYTPKRPTAPDSCDYGEANCDYSHDYERRVAQLNEFLKNGTIGRKEYNVLLERYRKNYEEHKD